jgi:hypothetical protein
MGLDTTSVDFVCAAKSFGVDFTDTLMVGRQDLIVPPAQLQRVFSILGIDRDAEAFVREHRYGEGFFSLMGASNVSSMDYSSYEEAAIIHDLNLPISADLRGRYSVVYDGGTLEHVFNVTQALKNCMEMVRVGGHFLQVNMANNFMGHGFWQFSPELIFRAFSPANGYQVEAVFLREVLPYGGWIGRNDIWYKVLDPDEIRQRVELCNAFRTYIVTIARRVADVEIFAQPPQQNFYSGAWEQHDRKKAEPVAVSKSSGSADVAPRRSWRRFVPAQIKRLLRSLRPTPNPFDRPYFKPIREQDFLQGKLK